MLEHFTDLHANATSLPPPGVLPGATGTSTLQFHMKTDSPGYCYCELMATGSSVIGLNIVLFWIGNDPLQSCRARGISAVKEHHIVQALLGQDWSTGDDPRFMLMP